MRPQRTLREAIDPQLLLIQEEPVARMELSEAADETIVKSFIMTPAAERLWQEYNRRLSSARGETFWIGGRPGFGKTHFLNYLIALGRRAGSTSLDPGRQLILAVAAAADSTLHRRIAEAIAAALGTERKAFALWRDLSDSELLRVVLDQARRQGVTSILLALDFGRLGPTASAAQLDQLAELSASLRKPRLIVVATGRGDSPSPKTRDYRFDLTEEQAFAVALARTRQFAEGSTPAILATYARMKYANYEATAIAPFHPAAASILSGLADDNEPIYSIARMARAALFSWRDDQAANTPLVWPSQLLDAQAISDAVNLRLDYRATIAIERARRSADSIDSGYRAIARELVALLILYRAARPDLAIDSQRLADQIAPANRRMGSDPNVIADVLMELAARSDGVIGFDARTGVAGFQPASADAPELATFNAALPMLRSFDAALERVAAPAELADALQRLREVMARALESAAHHRDALHFAAHEFHADMPAYLEDVLDKFAAIVESGPTALMEAAADEERRAALLQTVADYRSLEDLVSRLPRLRAMRAYLLATGLDEISEEPAPDQRIAAIQHECKLLVIDIAAALRARSSSSLRTLEPRFDRFKGNYVTHYYQAHEEWRRAMDAAAMKVADAEADAAALRRLNTLTALGRPEGKKTLDDLAVVAAKLTRCDIGEGLAPDVAPRCPRCGYTLGTQFPHDELEGLRKEIGRALDAKLKQISQSAIARLIEQHDHEHRLRGFLERSRG